MPVSEQTPVITHTGNGVTTVFAYNFLVLDQGDLEVSVDGVVKTITTDYSVSGVGAPSGGNITFVTAPANDSSVVIRRVMAFERSTDYQENGDLLAATLDLDIDRIWLALQTLNQNYIRSLKLSVDTTTDQVITQDAAERFGKLVGFDSSGNMTLLVPADLSLHTVSAFIATMLDDISAAAARATLEAAALAGSASQVFSVAIPTAAAHAMRADLSYVAMDFRLTLTSGTPVTTSDVTGATTIYCTPYTGNRIGLYDGTIWKNYTSAEFSLALGTLTSGLPYDVFCYQNSGTPTLEFLAWTNTTTRATALAYNSGILIKSGDATRRYLGTFFTTATTTTEDSATSRYLWNYYNRVNKQLRRVESTVSWAYSTAAIRQANGAAANQVNFIQGVAEDVIGISLQVHAGTSAANWRTVTYGVGLDSTTAFYRTELSGKAPLITGFVDATFSCSGSIPSQLGKHYISWLESGAGADTQTWYGGSNYSGLSGFLPV